MIIAENLPGSQAKPKFLLLNRNVSSGAGLETPKMPMLDSKVPPDLGGIKDREFSISIKEGIVKHNVYKISEINAKLATTFSYL